MPVRRVPQDGQASNSASGASKPIHASCRNRAAVVTARGAVYHLRMPGDATAELRVPERSGLAPRVELNATGNGDTELVVHGVHPVDRIEMRPSLFRDLHRPFALGAGERTAARVLLALLRLPGGAKLLRAWHSKRSA